MLGVVYRNQFKESRRASVDAYELIEKSTFSKREWTKRKINWAVRNMLEQGEEIKTWRVIQKAQISDEKFRDTDKIVRGILEEYID